MGHASCGARGSRGQHAPLAWPFRGVMLSAVAGSAGSEPVSLWLLCPLSFPLYCEVPRGSANVGRICYKASAAPPMAERAQARGRTGSVAPEGRVSGIPTLPGQRTPCDALITSCLFGLFGLFEGRRHAWGLASVSVANRSDIRKCSHFQAWRGGAPAGGPATASAPATWPPHSQAHGASGVAAGPADFCWWVFLSTCLSSVPPDTDVLITYSAPTPVGPHDASLLGLFVSALATWLLPLF